MARLRTALHAVVLCLPHAAETVGSTGRCIGRVALTRKDRIPLRISCVPRDVYGLNVNKSHILEGQLPTSRAHSVK
jgi:hypothetical protein